MCCSKITLHVFYKDQYFKIISTVNKIKLIIVHNNFVVQNKIIVCNIL